MILVDTYGDKEKSLDNTDDKSLKSSVDSLTKAINSMILLLKTAEKEVGKDQPQPELSKLFDKLIEQNNDIAKALVLLLEVNREHLPKIAAHTEATSKMMRRPMMHAVRREPRPEQRFEARSEPVMEQRREPRHEMNMRQVVQMPLPPEPRMPGNLLPNIPEAPAPEPKKKGGLFGLGR